MKGTTTTILAVLAFASAASAAPVPGTYTSSNRPAGTLYLARASVARPTVNSGFPKVFHTQSWDGTTLGTQYEFRCGLEAVGQPPDYSQYNAGTGNGFITYFQTFTGGTFSIYNVGSPGWGFGNGTLNTTNVTSQVFLVNFVPVSSSFTGYTTGQFDDGSCNINFAMGNGFGVGETPYLVKPATYPAFLWSDCSLADASHQFGTWGDVNDVIVNIGCVVPSLRSTWGTLKTLYR